MGGKEMRMEKVVCPKEAWPLKEAPSNESGSKPPAGIAKVISLADLKKK
jgi:hypothetical protein